MALSKVARIVGNTLTVCMSPWWLLAALIYRLGEGLDWLGHAWFDQCIDLRNDIVSCVDRFAKSKPKGGA